MAVKTYVITLSPVHVWSIAISVSVCLSTRILHNHALNFTTFSVRFAFGHCCVAVQFVVYTFVDDVMFSHT